jgi:hypothetical protein
MKHDHPGGPGQPSYDAILRRGFEIAEGEYLRARERGLIDPVVTLLDGEGIAGLGRGKVGLTVHEREEAVRDLEPESRAAAAAIRDRPPDRGLTIVVSTARGCSVTHHPRPTGPGSG